MPLAILALVDALCCLQVTIVAAIRAASAPASQLLQRQRP